MSASDEQIPNDPDPQAADRLARERIDALADDLSTAELVHKQQAVAVLEALEMHSSGALSDAVLVLAGRHYLRLRKESEGEEPDLDEVLRDVRDVLGK